MALRYFVNGGLNNNWTQTGAQSNWSTAPGGTGGASVPTNADDVIFDASSPNCNLDGNGTCLSFDANTYGAKTWSLNANNITVAGGIFRLGTGMNVTGTGTLIRSGTGNTLTSNAVTWPGSIQINANATHTWGGNWTILGNFTTLTNTTINGLFNITIGGSLTPTGTFTSNSTYILNGTGVLNGNITLATIIINTSPSNTITLTTLLELNGTTLIYTLGNVVVNTNHILRTFNLTVLDTDRTSTGGNKINFFNLSSGNSHRLTLSSNLTITNDFIHNGNNISLPGTSTLFIGRSITSTNPAGSTIILPPSGPSCTVEMNGSANGSISLIQVQTSLIINKSSPTATITLIGVPATNEMLWGSTNAILQRTNGIVNPGICTIVTNSNINITINDMTFWNLTISGGGTSVVTQNVVNTIQNNLTLGPSGNVAFAGTAGWDCANLICSATNRTITLQQAVTYRTRLQAFITGGTSGVRILMTSNSASVRAIWTLDQGASQSMIYVNGTRIDSSQGQTVWSFGVLPADIATTINWNPGSPPGTFAYTFLN
jgi:hypothetical protein